MYDFSVYFQESGFYQLHCFLQWWKQLSKSNFTSDITFSSFAAMELENSHHLMHKVFIHGKLIHRITQLKAENNYRNHIVNLPHFPHEQTEAQKEIRSPSKSSHYVSCLLLDSSRRNSPNSFHISPTILAFISSIIFFTFPRPSCKGQFFHTG